MEALNLNVSFIRIYIPQQLLTLGMKQTEQLDDHMTLMAVL